MHIYKAACNTSCIFMIPVLTALINFTVNPAIALWTFAPIITSAFRGANTTIETIEIHVAVTRYGSGYNDKYARYKKIGLVYFEIMGIFYRAMTKHFAK